jgi:hypothetical protein
LSSSHVFDWYSPPPRKPHTAPSHCCVANQMWTGANRWSTRTGESHRPAVVPYLLHGYSAGWILRLLLRLASRTEANVILQDVPPTACKKVDESPRRPPPLRAHQPLRFRLDDQTKILDPFDSAILESGERNEPYCLLTEAFEMGDSFDFPLRLRRPAELVML